MIYDQNSKGVSYWAGFFMLICFGVAGLIISALISVPIWKAMTGQPFTAMGTSLDNPEYINAYRVIQALSVIFGMLIPSFFTAWIMNRRPTKLLGFKKKITLSQVGLVILIMFLSLFVASALAYVNKQIPIPETWKISFDKLEQSYTKQVEVMLGMRNATDYIVSIFLMAFMPALCEETIFRGGLQNFAHRGSGSGWVAIILVSFLFSLIHFSYYGFLARMFLGVSLGLIFLYTGSVWLCIIGHFFNNALAISQYYFYSKTDKEAMKAQLPDDPPYYIGFIALPLLIFALIRLKKISNPDPILKTRSDNPFVTDTDGI